MPVMRFVLFCFTVVTVSRAACYEFYAAYSGSRLLAAPARKEKQPNQTSHDLPTEFS